MLKSSGLIGGPSSADARASLPKLDGNSAIDGKPILVPLALICDSPYQTSLVSEAKVAELVENLERNPLSSPIVLRRNQDGKIELIAGRHRVEAYRRMGRTEIEATLRELSDDEAERLVFYDNLFAPSMTDFQKYLGFRQRRERLNLTQGQLAEESGIDRTTVSRLLSFDGLPEAVFSALRENPQAIGSIQAPEFVALAQQSPDLAVQAIYSIALGDMTQKAAIAWLKTGGKVAEKPAKPEKFKALIKNGKQRYAELVRQGDKLVISLNTADKSIQDDLQAWLKNRAQQHFSNTNTEEGERAAD